MMDLWLLLKYCNNTGENSGGREGWRMKGKSCAYGNLCIMKNNNKKEYINSNNKKKTYIHSIFKTDIYSMKAKGNLFLPLDILHL